MNYDIFLAELYEKGAINEEQHTLLSDYELFEVEENYDGFILNMAAEDNEYERNFPLIVEQYEIFQKCRQSIKEIFKIDKVFLESNTLSFIASDDVEIILDNFEKIKIEDDITGTSINILKNEEEGAEECISLCEEYSIENIYNASEHYSDLNNDKIGVDVKLHNQNFPDVISIQKSLLERGFNKAMIEEVVTDDLIGHYTLQYNEDSWSSFEDINIAGLEFLGGDGRMGGYAIFKLPLKFHLDIDEIKDYHAKDFLQYEGDSPENYILEIKHDLALFSKFSDAVEALHTEVLEGLNIEDICSRIIEDELVLTDKQISDNEAKTQYENSRSYSEHSTPVNSFNIHAPDGINVTHWGGDKGKIGMDSTSFDTDELTGKVIYETLYDDYFGVQSIDGSDYIVLEQKNDIKRTYHDNGEVRNYINYEEVYAGSVDDQGNLDEEIILSVPSRIENNQTRTIEDISIDVEDISEDEKKSLIDNLTTASISKNQNLR